MIATGSEVAIAEGAAELVHTEDGNRIRVVSMPCMELFKSQAKKYRRSGLPKTASMHRALDYYGRLKRARAS